MKVEWKGGEAPQLGGDPEVRVWLRNANANTNGIRPVSAWRWEWTASPGDIVAYELTDGWLPHDQSGRPEGVRADSTVEYYFRGGLRGVSRAASLSWGRHLTYSGLEIARYRIAGAKPETVVTAPRPVLPEDAAERKALPVYSGFVRYFPDAMVEVAKLSRIGNDQHNPGKPLFWDRSKSGDETDALMRHLLDAGTHDTDGVRHSTKVAWRAMANLQKEIERDREAA